MNPNEMFKAYMTRQDDGTWDGWFFENSAAWAEMRWALGQLPGTHTVIRDVGMLHVVYKEA